MFLSDFIGYRSFTHGIQQPEEDSYSNLGKKKKRKKKKKTKKKKKGFSIFFLCAILFWYLYKLRMLLTKHWFVLSSRMQLHLFDIPTKKLRFSGQRRSRVELQAMNKYKQRRR